MSLFNTCPICKKILGGSICEECNKKADSINITPTKITPKKPNLVEDRDEWVGPIETPCIKCNKKTVKFSIISPPSPDEPPIITHRCFTCGFKQRTYKN